jgi:hypothetical protein
MLGREHLQSASRVSIGGRTVFCVKFKPPGSKPGDTDDELWIDPGRNYLVERMVHYRAPQPSYGITGKYEVEIQEAREVSPGVFLPGRVESRQYDKETKVPLFTWRMLQIQANQPLSPNMFELHFPKGTWVGDQNRGTAFEVDENEQPKGKSIALLKPQLQNSGNHTRFATGDPRNRSWISGPLVVCLAAMATVIVFLIWIGAKRLRRA